MISCKTLIYQPELSHQRFVIKHPGEGPVSFQLAGSNPLEVAEAAKIATAYGADLIDLNCGCPVKKIRSKGAGSSLLTNTTQLYQLICALKNNTHVPVSIKIRVEANSDEKCNAEVAKVVSEAGADFLVVHGRHWTENYETPCRYDEIQFFVNTLAIPVIGNGDIACLNSLKQMLATGCAGVMIARAGVGQPWLIRQLIAEMNQQVYLKPSIKEVGHIFIEHIILLEKLLGSEEFAIFQARKFAKYYARGIDKKTEFCEAMNRCCSLQALNTICLKYFY